ncbi:unnamed protein product [Gadus morhua 'NCC']
MRPPPLRHLHVFFCVVCSDCIWRPLAACLSHHADGMSGGEDSFNLNDPDEGFSSGASNSSQPSATKPGVAGGVAGRASSQKGGGLGGGGSSIKKAQQKEVEKQQQKEVEKQQQKEVEKQQKEAFEQQLRRQSPPAGITLDTIQLSPIKKHLSYPAGPALVRTASTSSSKSFDCMKLSLNGAGQAGEGPSGGGAGGAKAGGSRRHSTISLKEEHLVRPEENQDLLVAGAPLTPQSRSPSFNMQIISQV